jgi:hypothetical protein
VPTSAYKRCTTRRADTRTPEQQIPCGKNTKRAILQAKAADGMIPDNATVLYFVFSTIKKEFARLFTRVPSFQLQRFFQIQCHSNVDLHTSLPFVGKFSCGIFGSRDDILFTSLTNLYFTFAECSYFNTLV